MMNELDMFDETLVDDVFWSDSSEDDGQDAPELTSSEESEESFDSDDLPELTSSEESEESLDSDELPDLIEDPVQEGEVREELNEDAPGLNSRWLSARQSWWLRIRAEPRMLDDTILSENNLSE